MQWTTKKITNNKDWNYTRLNFLTLFVDWNCVLFLPFSSLHPSRHKNLSSSIQFPRSSCMAQFVTNAFFLFLLLLSTVSSNNIFCVLSSLVFSPCVSFFLLSIFHLFFHIHTYFIHICIISHRKCLCSTGCMLFARLCYIQYPNPPNYPPKRNFCMI